jgi:hypothetical protein
MGRIRRDGTTKVWHNPEISSGGRSGNAAAPRVTPSVEDRRTASAHRAALEALFSPKKEEDPGKTSKAIEAATGKAGRIVLSPPPQADPRAQDRQRLLGKLLHAEGRPAISKAVNEFFKQGFTLPQEQDVYLQLLEHANEERVREAMAALASILLSEPPKRRAVLESRLRRIEEYAEDGATRTVAAELRRQVTGRGVAASAKAPIAAVAAEAPPAAGAEAVEAEAEAVGTGAEAGEVKVAVATERVEAEALEVDAAAHETSADTAEEEPAVPAEVA